MKFSYAIKYHQFFLSFIVNFVRNGRFSKEKIQELIHLSIQTCDYKTKTSSLFLLDVQHPNEQQSARKSNNRSWSIRSESYQLWHEDGIFSLLSYTITKKHVSGTWKTQSKMVPILGMSKWLIPRKQTIEVYLVGFFWSH